MSTVPGEINEAICLMEQIAAAIGGGPPADAVLLNDGTPALTNDGGDVLLNS
jgi:hypothetical protein